MKQGDADFKLKAISTSGLKITYTNTNPKVATIVDGKIHIVALGSMMINAVQEGNQFYNPSQKIERPFLVTISSSK
jgi:uncharacterized protein YjdB